MLGMKNHFDISDSIEIREVDIAGVACILNRIKTQINVLILTNENQNCYWWHVQMTFIHQEFQG